VVVYGDEFGEGIKKVYEVTGGVVFYVTKVGEEQKIECRIYRYR
jgi:predicted sulfurtransferase